MQKARGQAGNRRSGFHSPPTACRQPVSGTISLPSPGCFSPFPHGTGSLSVTKEYLALGDGPPEFPQGFTCPAVLGCPTQEVRSISATGLSPSLAGRSRPFTYESDLSLPDEAGTPSDRIPRPRIHNASGLGMYSVWALSRSLAATEEITVVFFSWRY